LKIILFANTDWYLYNFRLSLARALQGAGYELLLLSPPGEYARRLQQEGFAWQPIPLARRGLNPLRELYMVLWLWRLFRRERPGLVYNFTIKCVIYGSLAARLCAVPRLNAVAGLGYVFTSQDRMARLLRPLVTLLFRLALGGQQARLVLQNQDDVALFTAAGLINPRQIQLIKGSGVDLARFKPGPRLDGAPADGRYRVLLAARLLWDKGIAEYVEAARQLQAQGLAVECWLAGAPDEGNPASVPAAQVRAWADAGLIRWLGHVGDMPGLLAQVDMVVLPSYYGEGVPRTLIEAAACALPLVTTDAPGCREVVTHEQDGLLVPPRDATALATAIRRLAQDRPLARRLGQAARDKALREFDEQLVIARNLELVKELAGSGRGVRNG
jgi:glycosyltransferase involved in cell wall biosynthesis